MLVSVTLPTLNLPGWPGTEEDTTKQSARTPSSLNAVKPLFLKQLFTEWWDSTRTHNYLPELVSYGLFAIGKMFPCNNQN